MEQLQLQETLECLGHNRTKFYYHKDRYALMLLSYYPGQSRKIGEIKNSKIEKLLNKPQVTNTFIQSNFTRTGIKIPVVT